MSKLYSECHSVAHAGEDNHLARILEPLFKESTRQPGWETFVKAESHIMNSQFILFTSTVIKRTLQPRSPPSFSSSITLPMPCPHLVQNQLPYALHGFTRVSPQEVSLELACELPGSIAHGSCKRCPADYSIQATGDRLKIETWQDFGTGGSPVDPLWAIQVGNSNNGRYGGPTVPHTQGRQHSRIVS